jgi:hypothetical protein
VGERSDRTQCERKEPDVYRSVGDWPGSIQAADESASLWQRNWKYGYSNGWRCFEKLNMKGQGVPYPDMAEDKIRFIVGIKLN